ncbi:MAG: class I SAM-dependent methyltransferase [Parcubacteria group bacterium]
MTRQNNKFTRIFLKVVRQYVKYYNDCSFKFYFDDVELRPIGNSPKIVEVKIKNAESVFKRIFMEGSVGLGESYCEGLIQVDDKDYKEFFFIFVRSLYNKKLLFRLSPIDLFHVFNAYFFYPSYGRDNQSEAMNGHYSLSDWFANEEDSNEFYLQWLDSPYIQYSCGKWDEDTKTLEEAQINKFEFYARRLGIDENSKGKTLLDLGCGWGGLMFYMAEKYGIKCKGLTLSKAQAKYVQAQIEKRNLSELVSVEIKNIHDLEGKYDYIASVGVMEHVDDFDDLYKKISQALNKNGATLIHAMFRREYFHRTDAFLLKYIFFKGQFPYLKNNLKIFRKYFKYVDRNDLSEVSYPKTLQCWYDKFCAHETEIRKLLKEKGRCQDIDFAIRVFKHYLVLSYCGLYEKGLVCNVLARN